VVLYFYPKDFTSGCTLEAHNFQTDLDKYKAANSVILALASIPPNLIKASCAKEGLAFKLLADVDTKVSDNYGSLMEYKELQNRKRKFTAFVQSTCLAGRESKRAFPALGARR
jgi:peroxiredoxin Q/BCP